MHIGGNTAAVILDLGGAIAADGDLDRGADTRHGFVDGVVHHLVEHVVEAGDTSGADVHGRPLPDRLEALEHLNVIGFIIVVIVGRCLFVHCQLLLPLRIQRKGDVADVAPAFAKKPIDFLDEE